MKKPFYKVISAKGETSARIDIYGVIGPDYWGDGEYIAGKKFVKDLQDLEANFERINIHINSPGGSIHEGLPIFNAIRASQREIHTYVDGIAYSMGFMIAIAGHKVHAAKGSLLMAHNAAGGAYGNARALRKNADILDKYDEVLGQLIADRTGKTLDEVNTLWLNMEDNFMSANEALDAKLIDFVEDYSAKDVPENIENLTTHQVAAYYSQNAQEPSPSFMAKVFAGLKEQFPKNQFSQQTMKFSTIEALAGIETPTAEQIDQANAELTTAGITNLTLVTEEVLNEAQNVTTERDNLLVTNQSLTSELETANTERTAAETKVSELESEITSLKEKLGKAPGAQHKGAAGTDEQVNVEDEDSPEALIANLPHNKAANALLNS